MIDDIDIHKSIVSSKVSFGKKGFKCFIACKDNEKVKPSQIMLPKMSEYRRNFNETKYMSFLMKDNELLEKYKIWDKISNTIKKGFNREPVYNKNHLITNQHRFS